jgi:hypothetical protein
LLAGFWLPLAALAAWSALSGRLAIFSFVGRLGQPWRLAVPWRPLLVLCGVFLVILAGIATAPPSKHDDLHYHLLVPHRGLLDGHWSPHPTPYLQAAPHIAYQALLTPLLAVGLPSAAGAFSLLWGTWLVLLVVERARRVSPARAALAAGVLLVALGNAVWWTTPNPTSVGTLWSSLLFLWLFDRQELCSSGQLGHTAYTAAAALYASAMFLTKVSFLLPAGFALLVVLLVDLRPGPFVRSALALVFVLSATAGPWLVFCTTTTGNPLGFAGAWVFGGVFDPQPLREALTVSRRINQGALHGFRALLDLNPLHLVLALGLGAPVLACRPALGGGACSRWCSSVRWGWPGWPRTPAGFTCSA